jgi:hypothetical protein
MIIQDNQRPAGKASAINDIRFADGGFPELLRWLDATPLVGEAARQRDYSDDPTSRDRAMNGWPAGVAKIGRGFPPPTFGAASRKPRWGFSVAGDLPDVGRYLSGHPDAMRRRSVDRGRERVVVLYLGCGMRANVSATDQLNFGIAVCEMIDALENAGTRVELNQLTRAHTGSVRTGVTRYAVTGWRIKEAADPLDLGPVAFSFMDEDAHRSIQFGIRQRMGNGVIGGSGPISPADFPDAPQGAIVMEGVNTAAGKCPNPKAARAFLRARLNQAAGHELVTAEMIEHLS